MSAGLHRGGPYRALGHCLDGNMDEEPATEREDEYFLGPFSDDDQFIVITRFNSHRQNK